MSKLSKVEEFEALNTAEELLAQLVKPGTVVKHLMEDMLITEPHARRIVKKAEDAIMSHKDATTQQRQAQHVARLEALYRRALAGKKFAVCERVLYQLGRVFNVEAPQHIVHSGSVSVDAEFSTRSESELTHFIEHGCWPEETGKCDAEKSVEQSVKDDPLGGLH